MEETGMELAVLCDRIGLQPQVKEPVLAFAAQFDFGRVKRQLDDFSDFDRRKMARLELQEHLGEDEDGFKLLACMLKASADAYRFYRTKRISDTIYFDTMGCYPRFVEETHQRTGRWSFARGWWTVRQAGCRLFRIGTLEYEIERGGEDGAIQIHIPSDGDLSPAAVDRSFEKARDFFVRYYPEMVGCPYCCRSWLLDGQLAEMLGDESHILAFQRRFELLDEGEVSSEVFQWVFCRQGPGDLASLPEKTSLQRNMKRHLLAGGVIRESCGQLRDTDQKK